MILSESKYASLFTDSPVEKGNEITDSVQPDKYNILLVDDEPNVLSALKRVFRHESYHIHTANNGKEALKLLSHQPCNIVITDFMMPGMNGADLLRKIKTTYPDTIRIMLTGHADTNAVMGAIKEGAVYKFILKPWNDDDLRVTVALALEQYDLQKKNKELQKQNIQNKNQLQTLSKIAVTNRSKLAILLHKRNLINEQQVQELYKSQSVKRNSIIKTIIEREWVKEEVIRNILRKDLMIDEIILDEVQIEPEISSLIPASLCQKQFVLPLRKVNRRLTLVMADPMDEGLISDLQFSIGLEIEPVMANIEDIQKKVAEVYHVSDVSFDELETLVSSADPYEGIEVVIDEDDELTIEDLLDGSDEPPAIRLVNAIVLEAVRLGASDIHIHPRTKSVVVRYRIDGVLQDKIQVPNNLLLPLVSRIKVMAELDISERRRPQDGRITVKTPMRIIDLRISTLPTINGEKVVMRILDRNSSVQSLTDLNLSAEDLNKLERVINKPQGIILTTGPTGSGKTTTLYSMLQHAATSEKNYVTIEDPVEYYLDMAGQVLIRERIGLDFATVLRAILRQDPDVILLGEIRDVETAEVAFHAALTGHLVYSTLHTNSAVATIARLIDFGLKPYIVASALEAIIAQRLVRRICDNCKEPAEPNESVINQLGPVFQQESGIKYFKGNGCPKCNGTGYKGRVGIYEVLIPGEDMRDLISTGASVLQVSEMARREGINTLIEDGKCKVNSGLTTADEVLRVVGPQVID